MNQQLLEQGSSILQKARSYEQRGLKKQAATLYLDAVGIYSRAFDLGTLPEHDIRFVLQRIGEYSERARLLIDVAESLSSRESLTFQEQAENTHNNDNQSVSASKYESRHSLVDVKSAVLLEQPKVSWSDVVGLQDAKRPMQEAISIPILFPGTPQAHAAHKGLLLFGPGGVGKTHLCRALAANSGGATFITIRPDMLLSKWVGESEKMLRKLFVMAREQRPTILFFDEVDSFSGSREEDSDSTRRFKNALLNEMDGMEDSRGVFIIGATNQPHVLDSSFLRRFSRRIFVELPRCSDRMQLISAHVKPYSNTLTHEDVLHLAKRTDGFSGSDLKTLVTEAGLEPLREFMMDSQIDCSTPQPNVNLRPVVLKDFKLALRNCTPANSASAIQKLEEWNEKFGSSRRVRNEVPRKSPGFWRTFKDVFGIPF